MVSWSCVSSSPGILLMIILSILWPFLSICLRALTERMMKWPWALFGLNHFAPARKLRNRSTLSIICEDHSNLCCKALVQIWSPSCAVWFGRRYLGIFYHSVLCVMLRIIFRFWALWELAITTNNFCFIRFSFSTSMVKITSSLLAHQFSPAFSAARTPPNTISTSYGLQLWIYLVYMLENISFNLIFVIDIQEELFKKARSSEYCALFFLSTYNRIPTVVH